MDKQRFKEKYSDIFQSFGSLSLEKRLYKIFENDTYLPYSSTFLCITNSQSLSFDYISKNFSACLGLDSRILKAEGMRYFWSRIHPEDLEHWLNAINELMRFTLDEIELSDRSRMNYIFNYRFKNSNDKYVNIVQNTTPLQFDANEKPIIGLAHYTIVPGDLIMPVCGSAKMLNKRNEYDTVYHKNFTQKTITDKVSKREREVIKLLALNYTSKQIAEELNISSNTVDTHRRNILKKLSISSTGEIIGMLKMNKKFI